MCWPLFMRYLVKFNLHEIHCFSIMSWPLSWLIVSTAYWSNRNSCCLHYSVLHQSISLKWVLVSDNQTSLLGHQHCEHFHSICMPMSLFSISVWCKGILGCGGFTPMHIWLLEVAGYVVVFYFLDQTSRNCLVWPTYIRIPQHIVATYAYSQTCHVWKISCLSSDCMGMGVVY